MTTNENGLSDLTLVARVLRGEPQAVDAFVARMSCISAILHHLNRRRGNTLTEQDLLELSQDVFERIWERLGTFRGEAALETWVYNFCVNTFANRARSSDRRRSREVDPLHIAEPTLPSTSPLDDIDAAVLITALDRLPEIDRQIVRMRLFEDHSFEKVGKTFDMPADTAKTRYYRALGRLHRMLAEKFGEGEAS